jgi:hypothetical protein
MSFRAFDLATAQQDFTLTLDTPPAPQQAPTRQVGFL